MTPKQLFAEFKEGFPNRKFSAGLLVAMIDFLVELGLPDGRIRTLDGLYAKYPRQTRVSGNRPANTLVVDAGERKIGLRPFYNRIEKQFISDES